MDIHPPEGPVHSVKDFFVHLSIVVAGILIALALEGLTERIHHRHLAEQARENLRAELTENRKLVQQNLKDIGEFQRQLGILRTVASSKQPGTSSGRSGIGHANIRAGFPTLSSTSWDTALATQAVGYMGYDEVQRYSEAYMGQKDFEWMSRKAMDALLSSISVFSENRAETPGKRHEILTFVDTMDAYVGSIRDIDRQLIDDYDKALR